MLVRGTNYLYLEKTTRAARPTFLLPDVTLADETDDTSQVGRFIYQRNYVEGLALPNEAVVGVDVTEDAVDSESTANEYLQGRVGGWGLVTRTTHVRWLCALDTDEALRRVARKHTHVGQLKLFTGTCAFLKWVLAETDRPLHIVYAGAAPGLAFGPIAAHPRVSRVYMVDPRIGWYALERVWKEQSWGVSAWSKCTLLPDMFDRTMAAELLAGAGTAATVLISDVRIGTSDAEIRRDQEAQAEWAKMFDFSCLKHRAVGDATEWTDWPEGYVYHQPWRNARSGEVRLFLRGRFQVGRRRNASEYARAQLFNAQCTDRIAAGFTRACIQRVTPWVSTDYLIECVIRDDLYHANEGDMLTAVLSVGSGLPKGHPLTAEVYNGTDMRGARVVLLTRPEQAHHFLNRSAYLAVNMTKSKARSVLELTGLVNLRPVQSVEESVSRGVQLKIEMWRLTARKEFSQCEDMEYSA